MIHKPTLARPRIVETFAAAALSTMIAFGLLTAVAGLFQHDGAPFERILAAEHACADRDSASEHARCMRSFAAVPDVRNVASR